MSNQIEDYEAIANMTDAQAAEILEQIHLMLTGGRVNGKSKLSMSYNVAIQKGIKALKSTAYIMATAAGAGYEVGIEAVNGSNKKKVAYICDGTACDPKRASCKRGGPCHHTTQIEHAKNFFKLEDADGWFEVDKISEVNDA